MSSKMTIMLAAALLIPAGARPLEAASSSTQGVWRTELMRHDLGVAGREAIQVRVDFPRGAEAPRHSHPGEEIAHILKGTIEFRLDGQPPVTLRAGAVQFIPAGTIHQARNVGKGSASVLATYIVEKGKPLVVPAH